MYVWLIYIVMQQKPIQDCKAVILQLNTNGKKMVFKELLKIFI